MTTMLLGSNGLKRARPGRCGARLRLRSQADMAEVAGRGGERVTSLSSNESRRTVPPSVRQMTVRRIESQRTVPPSVGATIIDEQTHSQRSYNPNRTARYTHKRALFATLL